MKSYDFEAVTYNGEIYCNGCLPEGIGTDHENVNPIFAGSEWDCCPVCCVCGEIHDYVTLLNQEQE